MEASNFVPTSYDDSTQLVATVADNQYMKAQMKKPKASLDSTLVGRKCKAKYNHLWFGRASGATGWDEPMPTDEGTIVAAFTSREDGETAVKVIVESEKGETQTFYIESLVLVQVPK